MTPPTMSHGLRWTRRARSGKKPSSLETSAVRRSTLLTPGNPVDTRPPGEPMPYRKSTAGTSVRADSSAMTTTPSAAAADAADQRGGEYEHSADRDRHRDRGERHGASRGGERLLEGLCPNFVSGRVAAPRDLFPISRHDEEPVVDRKADAQHGHDVDGRLVELIG